MRIEHRQFHALAALLVAASLAMSACQPREAFSAADAAASAAEDFEGTAVESPALQPAGTPIPDRPVFSPGELVAYTAQTGDNLPALAARFNTTIAEIMAANPIVPNGVSTLPPGLPMQIPIYYLPFWGSPYQILPDSLYVNGPAQVTFSTAEFITGHDGWINGHREYAAGANRTAAQTIDYVALNFSISPQLLLALLEYQSGGLSDPAPASSTRQYPLGNQDRAYRGLYLQLVWAANLLNNGYYRWRSGDLTSFDLLDGQVERPDPWQNAASVALQFYFAQKLSPDDFTQAIAPSGFAQTYAQLFGDPWETVQPHIPGSLEQPTFVLPFESGRVWALTGGPHTAWGEGEPLAALDFAPPAVAGGCQPSSEWATAVAPGVIVRSELGTVVLDLDGDGDERTGWTVFYFHVATENRARLGASVQTGDPIGHPSCEGGRTTGTHVHIARKYNGEWVIADGPLAFNLEGWVAKNGSQPYEGSLSRFEKTVSACVCSNEESHIQSGGVR